jgi:hypothetical protein
MLAMKVPDAIALAVDRRDQLIALNVELAPGELVALLSETG